MMHETNGGNTFQVLPLKKSIIPQAPHVKEIQKQGSVVILQ